MRRGLERLLGLLRSPVALAAGAQVISSLANFVFLLALVARLAPATFGLYSIAFAVVLAGTAILQGFFQLQMVTTLPKLAVERRHDFASALFMAQGALALALVIPALALALLPPGGAAGLWQLAAASGLAILGLSGKEFLIRYLFAAERVSFWIPAMNLLAAAVLTGLAFSGLPAQGAPQAMLAYALAQIAGLGLGLPVARLAWRPRGWRSALRSTAANGAWGAFSAVTYSLRASAHTFIVGATLPLAQVGQMNAARTLLTPATLLIPTLSAVTLPRLSRTMAEAGAAGLGRLALRMGLVLAGLVLAYAAALALAWPLLVRHLLGQEFARLGAYVALWSVFALLTGLRNVAEWVLQAMQAFKPLSFYNLIAAGVTLAAVLALTLAWGVIGAIAGLVLGEIFLTGLILRHFHQHTTRPR